VPEPATYAEPVYISGVLTEYLKSSRKDHAAKLTLVIIAVLQPVS